MRLLVLAILCVLFLPQDKHKEIPSLFVLGTAQDGGYPHAGCQKKCCTAVWQNPEQRINVVSLALADPVSGKWWLFEATPDFSLQLQLFHELTGGQYPYLPEGIFITHAHIGHYTGLIHLGREVMGAKDVKVYAHKRLKKYLETNGPWSQLVSLENINIQLLQENVQVALADDISVNSMLVPHRDEYSETAGFVINARNTTFLFIPDIDKWEKWNRNIIDEVKKVDLAFLDATFYSGDELPNRSMSEIPHPFVMETMELFKNAPAKEKKKLHFIHINHSNPLLWDSATQDTVRNAGFNIAKQGMEFEME